MKTTYDELYDELKSGLRIDKHNLDDELQRQAELYNKCGEALAYATSERDAAKEDLARTDAELYDNVAREDDKLSDTKIRSRVMLRPEHDEATDKYARSRLAVEKLTSMLEAYRQRSSMLRQLAEMYIANYYSSDSAGRTRDSGSMHRRPLSEDRNRRGSG